MMKLNKLFRTVLATSTVVIGLLSGGCGTNPVTGRSELQFVSENKEIAIGKENYVPSQQSQGGEYVVDPALTAYVQSVGKKLAAVSDRPELPYEFVVLNNSVPNAWALPGGKIAFNRGLLVALRNEAELAAVLGHEITHAAARHGAQGMERGMLLQGALLATAIKASGTNYAGLIVGGAQTGVALISSKYGRDAENEADHYGMIYMQRAGYDPYAAVTLQQLFVDLFDKRQANWLEGMFASHPPSRDRVEANKKFAAKLGIGGDLGEQRFLQKINQLKRTKPAYEKYDKAQKALRDNNAAEAKSLIAEALKIEPREALFFGVQSQIALQQQDYVAAKQAADKAISLNPRYFAFYLERGLANKHLNQHSAAERDFKRSLDLLPTATAHKELGDMSLAAGDKRTALEHYEIASGSSSADGKSARQAFAKLALAEQPQRFIVAQAGLDRSGFIVIAISNKSPVAVRNVEAELNIEAGLLGGNDPLRVRETIPAGETVYLQTQYGPYTKKRSPRIDVRVVHAEPVKRADD